MSMEQPPEQPSDVHDHTAPDDPVLAPVPKHRISDRAALGILGGWFGSRMFISRILGNALLPWMLANLPWAMPLLNNLANKVIIAGAEVHDRPVELVALGACSMLISTVAGLLLFWAGWRFGPQLAKKAEEEGSAWAAIWNPKQVAKAHDVLERRGVFAVVVSRLTSFLLTPVCVVAGSSRMSPSKFIAAHTAGALTWTAGVVFLGQRTGTTWPWLPEKIKSWAGISQTVGLVLLVVLVILLLATRRSKTDEPQAPAPEGDTA